MVTLVKQHAEGTVAADACQFGAAKQAAVRCLHTADSLSVKLQQGQTSSAQVALGPLHVWRMRVQQLLLRVHMELQDDWTQALKAAQALTPVYELVYPEVGTRF